MKAIGIYVEELIHHCGVTGEAVVYVRYAALILTAVILAALAGYACRRCIPLVHRLTARTANTWDDMLLNDRLLRSASRIVPAVVIWQLLPLVFFEHPTARELTTRLTAIYITVMATRTLIVLTDSLKLFEGEKRTAAQQYLYSFCGLLKIVLIFVAAIVVVSIMVDQSPATLLTGLGAASAVMMLVFQDTIKGLVAGIRLTSNDVLHKGDWITVPSAGANGIVEEISLTVVKVRNFDNTIISVPPQVLADGAFQNWKGMQESGGRKQVRKVYFNYRSVRLVDEAIRQRLLDRGFCTEDELRGDVVNLTLYRRHMEDYFRRHPNVNTAMPLMARQMDGTPTGLPVEFTFHLKDKEWAPFEHVTSDIMEYAYAAADVFGLAIYQQMQSM